MGQRAIGGGGQARDRSGPSPVRPVRPGRDCARPPLYWLLRKAFNQRSRASQWGSTIAIVVSTAITCVEVARATYVGGLVEADAAVEGRDGGDVLLGEIEVDA